MLGESGWTLDVLARAVNAVGAETGRSLRYDRTAVWHWLRGTQPRGPVPALIAEAFTRKLGRPIAVADTGFADRHSVTDPPEPWTADPGHQLGELANHDLDPTRHAVLARSIYRLEALAVPDWPTTRRALTAAPQAQGPVRVDPDHVRAARAMLKVCVACDHYFGGGYARTALVAYLAHDVAASLHVTAPTRQRRELLGAAADLVCLAGFRCFDDHAHGLAMRYYRIALALAAHANDPIRFAVILRCMSYQAHYLGHYSAARTLIDQALAATAGTAPAHTEAFLHVHAAVCHAAAGNDRTAQAHRSTARHQLDLATDPAPMLGSCHPAELQYLAAHVLLHRGDRYSAEHALRTAIRRYPVGHRRSRALAMTLMATLHLDTGRFSRARTIRDRLRAEYAHLRSARTTTAMANLEQRLKHRWIPR